MSQEKQPPQIEKEVNITVGPVNGIVHIRIEHGKESFEFNMRPFDAISLSHSFMDASIIARIQQMLKEEKAKE